MNAPASPFESVRYALVGFGRYCRNRLMRAFQEISGSTVVSLYHREAQKASAAADEFGIPHGSGNLDEVLSHPQVEAVYITSPNADHEAQAITAALAGKHVLCEKPMATTAAGCRRMIETCQRQGVLLMVAQTLRFSPVVRRLREWIQQDRLGRIVYARAAFTYDGTKSPRGWLYDQRLAGGGVLMDVGVHCLDTLRFLLGEVEEFDGFVGSPMKSGVERTASVHLRFVSGALANFYCSYESPYHSRLEIQGEKGRAWVEPFTLPWADVILHLETERDSADLPLNTGNPYGALIESFSRAIRGLDPVLISGEEGWANQEIIEALYRKKTKRRG